MSHLRRLILAFVIYLSIFYNIERLDLGQANAINIESAVYVLVILSIISVIGLRALGQAHFTVPLLLWIAIYLAVKLIFLNDHPLVGGPYTYLTITEIALLAIAILFAHQITESLQDFEAAVKNITLAGVSRRLKKFEAAAEEIEIELARSRRHQRPLTMLIVKPDPGSIQATVHRTIREIQQAMVAQYVVTGLAHVISSELRRSDLVIDQHEQGRFIIFSPDTPLAESETLIARLQSTAAKQLNVTLNVGKASFPEQAVTFEELVRQAECDLEKLESAPAPTNPISTEARGET